MVIRGPLERDGLIEICEQARLALAYLETPTVCCEVGELPADGVTLDTLARLQLEAKRQGRKIELRRPCNDLRDLIELVGLSEVLAAGS